MRKFAVGFLIAAAANVLLLGVDNVDDDLFLLVPVAAAGCLGGLAGRRWFP